MFFFKSCHDERELLFSHGRRVAGTLIGILLSVIEERTFEDEDIDLIIRSLRMEMKQYPSESGGNARIQKLIQRFEEMKL